jgi:hypothetical protein
LSLAKQRDGSQAHQEHEGCTKHKSKKTKDLTIIPRLEEAFVRFFEAQQNNKKAPEGGRNRKSRQKPKKSHNIERLDPFSFLFFSALNLAKQRDGSQARQEDGRCNKHKPLFFLSFFPKY